MVNTQNLSKIKRFIITFQLYFLLKNSSSKNDTVSSFPGQRTVRFKQYAGYITVHDKSQRDLFYYFVEVEIEPQTKPLVLWLNGGPCCSSIGAGAFSKHGPFRPKGDALIRNNYSWNKEKDNLNFLLKWLEAYPEYKGRDLFITGESYAVHYAPQLTNLVLGLGSELKSKLKGITEIRFWSSTQIPTREESISGHTG